MGDLLEESTVRARDVADDVRRSAEVLSLTKDRGLIRQVDRFGRRIATPDLGNYKVVTEGQIVYNPYVIWEGAICALRGFSVGLVSPAYVVWQVKEPDEGYLDYLLRTPTLLRSFNRVCSGSVNRRRSISRDAFLSIRVKIPRLSERRAIAVALTAIRQTVAASEGLVAATRQFKQSLMNYLFSQSSVVSGQNDEQAHARSVEDLLPTGWHMSSIARVIGQDHGRRTWAPDRRPSIPFVPMALLPIDGTALRTWEMRRPEDIKSGVPFYEGDVLLAKITPCFENGKLGLARDIPGSRGVTSTEVYSLHAKDVSPEYLAAYLSMSRVRKALTDKMQGTTGRQRLPREALLNYPIPVPPTTEQHGITGIISVVNVKLKTEEERLGALDNLYKSVLQNLMTGQIRLPGLEEQQS